MSFGRTLLGRRAVHAGALALCACACAGTTTPQPRAATESGAHEAPPEGARVIDVPREPVRALARRRVVARGLLNPRGMQLVDGGLLVAEAGTGDPGAPSGRLLKLIDENGDGDYLDEGEARVLLEGQPSKNILEIVRRDEVFGMAGMDRGLDKPGGEPFVMVSLAFFGGPSTLFAVRGDRVEPWGKTHGNINDVAFDPARGAWFGASSTTDEVVELLPGNGSQRVLKLPTLASGQDAVPGYLRHDPVTRDLLVSLFSGSPEGEEGGDGTELVPRAASIVRVDPDRKTAAPLVTGLTVPTDLEVDAAGALYVLEFCDAFLDPVGTREAMSRTSHGGFKRYSGRLLRIDRASGAVQVIADQLDAPTNLALAPGGFFVAQGMGTPGRVIPTPQGDAPLEGFIEHVAYP